MNITVVIPIYKTPLDLLRNSVASALSIRGAKVILVVDSPGDPSEEYASKLVKQYPQVRLLVNDCNKGVSYSRNRGLDAVDTEWLTFLDADDEVDSKVYDEGLKLAVEMSLDAIAVGGINSVEELSEQSFLLSRYNDTNSLNLLSLLRCVGMSSCSVIYRRSYIEKYNIRFSTELTNNEDFLFFTKIVQNGANLALYYANGYIQHGHPESTTRSAPMPERYFSCVKASRMVMEILKFSELQEDVLAWYARRIIWQMTLDIGLFKILDWGQKKAYARCLKVSASKYSECFSPVLSCYGKLLMLIFKLLPILYLLSPWFLARPMWHFRIKRLFKHKYWKSL